MLVVVKKNEVDGEGKSAMVVVVGGRRRVRGSSWRLEARIVAMTDRRQAADHRRPDIVSF